MLTKKAEKKVSSPKVRPETYKHKNNNTTIPEILPLTIIPLNKTTQSFYSWLLGVPVEAVDEDCKRPLCEKCGEELHCVTTYKNGVYRDSLECSTCKEK